jgi:hypothetical protein
MFNRVDRSECERLELIDAIAERISFVRESTDRIGNVWALKIIAENVARLDQLDRQDGFLPPQVRPPLMIHCREADLALNALREYTGLKGCDAGTDTAAFMRKLKGYLV